MKASILPIGGSGHWPVQIHFSNLDKPQNRPFRFEAFWTEHPSFMQNIQNWWTQATIRSDNIMYIIQQKLKTINTNLKQWKKDTFGDIIQAKRELEVKMVNLQQTLITDGPNEEQNTQESIMQSQWEERLKQEKLLWRQKSRVQWLKHRERNTSFFHNSTIQNRAFNRTLSLKTADGDQVFSRDHIESELNSYFTSLLNEPLQD